MFGLINFILVLWCAYEMVLGKILQAVTELFRRLFSLFGIMSPVNNITEGPNTLRVFIKYAGKTISTDLDPSWTIKQVKDAIAPKLQVSADEIKIIFAGNELPDSFILEVFEIIFFLYLQVTIL